MRGEMKVEAEVEQHVFAPDGGIPNSRLPLLLLRDAFPPEARDGTRARRLLERNGWTGTWVTAVFPFWHFHTKGHEVLACVSGEALIGFGGDRGIKAKVKLGDVCLIPAGVGHKLFEGSDDFLVAGGYPPGQEGEITKPGGLSETAIARAIDEVKLPESDPIKGGPGGLLKIWMQASGTF